MLLVIDVGNTNTVLGVFDGDQLIENWRVRTERNATEDEVGIIVANLFRGSRIQFEDIQMTVISCVVPPVITALDSFCRKYLGHTPKWIDTTTSAGMPILYSNPAEVGADRIVNAVAAYERYKQSLIVIDFGTATTFDAISEKGEYLGGAISPGIKIAAEALFARASKLPRIDLLLAPEKVVGKDTSNSMKSGIIYGYAGLVDGMVKRMKIEMGGTPKVVATGGLAVLMEKICHSIEAVEPNLTLEGLLLLSKKI